MDRILLGDLYLILQASPLLMEAYDGLPENQRNAVDNKFLELIWQTILAGATEAENTEPLIDILNKDKTDGE